MLGLLHLLPLLFPIFFIGLWLFVTLLLGRISRWPELQRRFPDTGEAALLTERWCSAQLNGVRMNNVLTLAACPSGLRMTMSRLFGPFLQPVLVPWREIDVEQTTAFFVPLARLRLGRPATATMLLRTPLWQRLAAASPNAPASIPPAESASAAGTRANRVLLLQWLALTGIAGAAFFLLSRTGPPGQALPPFICFLFPGFAFGIIFGLRALMRR